jgi:hypothetical protein
MQRALGETQVSSGRITYARPEEFACRNSVRSFLSIAFDASRIPSGVSSSPEIVIVRRDSRLGSQNTEETPTESSSSRRRAIDRTLLGSASVECKLST